MRAAAATILLTALSACTPGAQTPPDPAAVTRSTAAASAATAAAPVSLEAGTDVGNGRPTVSHDGLMVRRRAVIAIHPAQEADLGSVRSRLDQAAAGRGLDLSEISPDVLGPAVLAHLVPELIVALPPESTRDDAEQLADDAVGQEGSFPGVEHVHVASVLVHDLQFTLASADPETLIESIAAEGILSDALGNYAASVEGGGVAVIYTGPLLSDALVEAVRTGMARSAGVSGDAVAVMPRSSAGEGVDLSKEPKNFEPEGAEDEGHEHSLKERSTGP